MKYFVTLIAVTLAICTTAVQMASAWHVHTVVSGRGGSITSSEIDHCPLCHIPLSTEPPVVVVCTIPLCTVPLDILATHFSSPSQPECFPRTLRAPPIV